jgi:hypothetical protein
MALKCGFKTCPRPRLAETVILAKHRRRVAGRAFVEYTVVQADRVRVYRQHGRGRREYWTTFKAGRPHPQRKRKPAAGEAAARDAAPKKPADPAAEDARGQLWLFVLTKG